MLETGKGQLKIMTLHGSMIVEMGMIGILIVEQE